MITVDQLALLNLVPRGKSGCCVLAALRFTTGADYFDIEELVQREQPHFRPDLKTSGGVFTDKLLGQQRCLFGHRFIKVVEGRVPLNVFRGHFPTGTFLVRRKRHAFVIKDGKVFDWFDNTDRCDILAAWKVEKVA